MPPEAAWYPDPEDPTQLRWWDGSAWTDHRHPVVSPPPLGADSAASLDQDGPEEPGSSTSSGHLEQHSVAASAIDADGNVDQPEESSSWPPAADESTFEARAAANAVNQPAPTTVWTTDPDQELYRRLANVQIWAPTASDDDASTTPIRKNGATKDNTGALTILFVVAVLGACFLIFGHGGGNSGSSGAGGSEPAVVSRQEECERSQVALDKTAEILRERGEVPAYHRLPSKVAEEHGVGC